MQFEYACADRMPLSMDSPWNLGNGLVLNAFTSRRSYALELSRSWLVDDAIYALFFDSVRSKHLRAATKWYNEFLSLSSYDLYLLVHKPAAAQPIAI